MSAFLWRIEARGGSPRPQFSDYRLEVVARSPLTQAATAGVSASPKMVSALTERPRKTWIRGGRDESDESLSAQTAR